MLNINNLTINDMLKVERVEMDVEQLTDDLITHSDETDPDGYTEELSYDIQTVTCYDLNAEEVTSITAIDYDIREVVRHGSYIYYEFEKFKELVADCSPSELVGFLGERIGFYIVKSTRTVALKLKSKSALKPKCPSDLKLELFAGKRYDFED